MTLFCERCGKPISSIEGAFVKVTLPHKPSIMHETCAEKGDPVGFWGGIVKRKPNQNLEKAIKTELWGFTGIVVVLVTIAILFFFELATKSLIIFIAIIVIIPAGIRLNYFKELLKAKDRINK